MKLTFIYTDTWGAYNNAMCGASCGAKRRTVQIELTPKQLELVKPRQVGTSGKNPINEHIDVFVEGQM